MNRSKEEEFSLLGENKRNCPVNLHSKWIKLPFVDWLISLEEIQCGGKEM